jgi:hypothetical protein
MKSACSSCASLAVLKVSVSAMKVCNIAQKYLIFYIATYSEHMHNSNKLVSNSVVYFLMKTEHFNQVGILHKINCLRTTGALESFSKIHIPYFVFLLISGLSLQYCQQWTFVRNTKAVNVSLDNIMNKHKQKDFRLFDLLIDSYRNVVNMIQGKSYIV